MDEARYTVISCDAHAGADVTDYRPYLAASFHDEFDAWAATYEVPFADLLAPIRYRNWDSDAREREHEADGIVGEVLFPNTVPPFFEEGNLVALPPNAEDALASFRSSSTNSTMHSPRSSGQQRTSPHSVGSCCPQFRPAPRFQGFTTLAMTHSGACAKKQEPSSISTVDLGFPTTANLRLPGQ